MRYALAAVVLWWSPAIAFSQAVESRDNGTERKPFTLQLLHASDLEGGIDAIDNAPNFTAVVERLRADAGKEGSGIDATILLSAGDNCIPGPFFGAAGDASLRPVLRQVVEGLSGGGPLPDIRESPGRADIAIMNVLGFDASALGNHEFDDGTATLGGLIGADIRQETNRSEVRWTGTRFPYLSGNLDFSGDAHLEGLFTDRILPNTAFVSDAGNLAAAVAAPKIARATVIQRHGRRFGVVGATTQRLKLISSPGGTRLVGSGDGDDMPALAAILQPIIDDVSNGDDDVSGTDDDVTAIVLVSHLQQLALETRLIGLLHGVDVVIAGGSDTILADQTDRLRSGDRPVGGYPVVTVNADGEPAVVVSTDGEYRYVGRLVVTFDDRGVLAPDSIDPTVSGIYATDDKGAAAFGRNGPFPKGSKAETVRRIVDAVGKVTGALDRQVVGRTNVFLEGRRVAVRTQETNLGNLVADALLAAGRKADPTVSVSLKNGGGIRAPIGEVDGVTGQTLPPRANPAAGKRAGDISVLDIQNALRFDNRLTLLTVSAANLKALLETGVSGVAAGATPGGFPQVGGMRFSFDPSLPAGTRVRSLVLVDGDKVTDTVVTDGKVVGDPCRAIRLATLDHLADGGDGYDFPTLATNDVATDIGEQQAVREYLTRNFSDAGFDGAETPPHADRRVRNLAAADD